MQPVRHLFVVLRCLAGSDTNATLIPGATERALIHPHFFVSASPRGAEEDAKQRCTDRVPSYD